MDPIQSAQKLETAHETRDRLRASYNIAVREDKEQFRFDGQQILTTYAKYLLEYLDDKLGRETSA